MGSERIAFPGLGLEFNIDPVAFTVLGKPIFWYGIIISFALIICIIWAVRDSARLGFKSDDVVDFVLFAVPAAVIGARLYYVAFKWQDYASHPIEIFQIWNGGLAIYGAVIAGVFTAWIFTKIKSIKTLKWFDFCAPFLVLGQAIGRWGNFINHEAYGTQTNLPWRMEIPDPNGISMISVHPTFLYESFWNIAIFILLLFYRKGSNPDGNTFFLYLVLYGLGRFWIEGLRVDSLMLGPFRISQLISAVLVIVFALVIFIRKKKVKDRISALDSSAQVRKG